MPSSLSRFVVGLILLASSCLCNPCSFGQGAGDSPPAQPPPVTASDAALNAVSAAINSGGATPIAPTHDGGIFEQVALQRHQRITIALTSLPQGDNTIVQAPDGGTLSDHTLIAQGNAPVVFTFEPGQHPGVYRVIVWSSAGKCELQFLVVDPANPLPADSRIPHAY